MNDSIKYINVKIVLILSTEAKLIVIFKWDAQPWSITTELKVDKAIEIANRDTLTLFG